MAKRDKTDGPKFYSPRCAAKMLSMSPRRLNEICQKNGIGTIVGGSGNRVLAQDDIGRIAAYRRPRGRPRKESADTD